jgi:flagellar biosynthetic protein FlhB
MGEDSGEKTEEPTPHKLREARKKGQVAKSKDLTAALVIIAAFYSLKVTAFSIWEQITQIMIRTYEMIPGELTTTLAGSILNDTMWVFLKAVLPIFLANFIVAVIAEMFQTGFVFSLEPLSPDLNKLNILEGVKKLFSMKQVVELIKSLVKMAIVTWLIFSAIKNEFIFVLIAQQVSLWQNMVFVGNLIFKIILRIGMFYIIIGLLDYMYQRYEYIKGLRMSKKEIKDEYKRLEGDPTVKQRQKDAARQMAQGRQTGAVPGADVVVTNPTHYAIAIAYKPQEMKAPMVLAKGENLFALNIRKIAEENQIPIIENKPLAQALFRTTGVDQEIPPHYYKAVAEILAFVYNLKKKRKHRY